MRTLCRIRAPWIWLALANVSVVRYAIGTHYLFVMPTKFNLLSGGFYVSMALLLVRKRRVSVDNERRS